MNDAKRLAGMELVIERDYAAMSQAAADFLIERIAAKPDLLLCLATGSSPTGAYEVLAERVRLGFLSCDRVRVLKLDEWCGVAGDDPCTCESYLRRHFLLPMGIGGDRYAGFRGDAEDLVGECGRIDGWLAEAGPIDVCVLGLGANGHLGLNEPAAWLQACAHVAELSQSTRCHPMLTKAGRAPRRGLTLGMADIMRARHIVLLVNGAKKAEPMRELMSRRIGAGFPASMLWMHPSVRCFCDREAASRIDG